MAKTKVIKKRNYRNLREYTLEKLKDPILALAYLNEACNDDNQQAFLLALKNVLEAQDGDITTVAQEADLSRQGILRILSKSGNPKLTSVRSLLHVLGLELAVQPYKK